MDWKLLIAELVGLGLTQPQIAEAAGCRQSTISELARGVTKDPRHSLGEKLRDLLEEKRAESGDAAARGRRNVCARSSQATVPPVVRPAQHLAGEVR